MISKKIAIRLNKTQDKRARNMLSAARWLWIQYIQIQWETLQLENRWIGNFEFDKEYYPSIAQENPWLPESLSGSARQDMLKTCYRAFVSQMRSRQKPKYRSARKSPIKSFFFVKTRIRFNGDDISHLCLPILSWVKLRESTYLKPEDLQYVTGGRIVLDHDKWYAVLHLDVPDDYVRKAKSFYTEHAGDGIGIDLGIHTMVTYAVHCGSDRYLMQSNSYNPAIDEYTQSIHAKIARLNRVIDHKVNCNKLRFGYDLNNFQTKVRKEDADEIYRSKSILKLRKRIVKLYDKLNHHKYDSLKKCISNLVRTKPDFICIEDLDAMEMKERHGSRTLRKYNARSGFGWFRDRIIEKCKQYHIPLYEVPLYYPSSKRCSRCGHKRKKLDISERVYFCPKCGLIMDRDENAARNMYHFGKARKPDLIRLDTLEEMIAL